MFARITSLLMVGLISFGTLAGARGISCDVVVVGGGGAGLSAAIEAANAGADVVLLEKMPFLGGSTLISGGIVYAANTSIQQQLGISDSADAMYRYWMTLNQWQIDPARVRTIAEESGEAIDWLMELGVEFPVRHGSPGLYVSGVEDVPRGHAPVNAGRGLTTPLIDKVKSDPKITIMLDTEGIDIFTESGRVVGILALDKSGAELDIRSNAVVLATGGFARDEEMMRRYLPRIAALGSRLYVQAALGSTGDGIRLGAKLGADLVGMEQITTIVLPGLPIELEPVKLGAPAWLLFVNRNGQRFINEAAPYVVKDAVMELQEQGLVWAICDSAALEGPWEEIDRYVETGFVVRRDTLDELALELGISPRGLVNTVKKHNADVALGKDTLFFKDPAALKSFTTPPFYGVQVLPSRVLLTTGGLRVSPQAEVLTPEGDVIVGFYAAGEVTGGTLVPRYPGSGSAIAEAIVYGRIAGRNAAKVQ